MKLIQYGYDKAPGIHERGMARPDWSLRAIEDSRGLGWQVIDLRGNRSPHLSKDAAIAALLSR